MKRLDDGKVSLVEFLGSIKFNRQQNDTSQQGESEAHFARLHQRVRVHGHFSGEENQLIRSAN